MIDQTIDQTRTPVDKRPATFLWRRWSIWKHVVVKEQLKPFFIPLLVINSIKMTDQTSRTALHNRPKKSTI